MHRLRHATFDFLLLIVALSVSGCGFHLRGFNDVPQWLNPVAIVEDDVHYHLSDTLKSRLEADGVRVLDNPQQAPHTIILLHDETLRNISSISSSTTPRQYELIYKVKYKVIDQKGAETCPPQTVVVSRLITINGNRILGSTDEEELTKAEMRQTAITMIINKLGH